MFTHLLSRTSLWLWLLIWLQLSNKQSLDCNSSPSYERLELSPGVFSHLPLDEYIVVNCSPHEGMKSVPPPNAQIFDNLSTVVCSLIHLYSPSHNNVQIQLSPIDIILSTNNDLCGLLIHHKNFECVVLLCIF